MPNSPLSFLAFFGSTPYLSQLELQTLLGKDTQIELITPQIARFPLNNPEEALKLQFMSGGLVKVSQVITEIPTSESHKIVDLVTEHLATKEISLNFGLAFSGEASSLEISPQEIKSKLKKKGVSSRYLDTKSRGISAAIMTHQSNVFEIVIIGKEGQLIIGETLAMQDIDDWSFRDRSRPYADHKRGLLPPKLARMMVNLARPDNTDLNDSTSDLTLYDPFCGAGTVLMEAAMTGWQSVGSDVSQIAITGTKKNVEWFHNSQPDLPVSKVFLADATHPVIRKHLDGHVDAIVTEPFLGKQTPKPHEVPNIFRGLEKLYKGAFKNWKKVLKSGAKVVMVFPHIDTETKLYDFWVFIDDLKTLGYTISSGPVIYARPGTIVKRQIWVLTYNPEEETSKLKS